MLGNRVISRNHEHHWAPYSPNLICLDFGFWSLVSAHVIRCEPQTLEQLKESVEDFTRNMGEEQLRKMARHTRRRAELCRAAGGGHFEHLLQTNRRAGEHHSSAMSNVPH